MSNIHLVAQGKGAVRKSFVFFVLAQYLQNKMRSTRLIDTDPSNQTFSLVKSLSPLVKAIELNNTVVLTMCSRIFQFS